MKKIVFLFIHKVIQKLGIWQSWRPKFSPSACTGAEADPIRNRVDASGWTEYCLFDKRYSGRIFSGFFQIWDANAAKNQFLKHLVYMLLGMSTLICDSISWSSPPVTLSNTSLNSSDPQIAVDTSGNLVALWAENGFIKASSKPFGMSWGSVATLSASGSSAPRVVSDLNGNAVAVWLEGTTVKGASKLFAGSWSGSTTLSSSGASNPDLAVDSAGDAIVAWARAGNIQTATKLFGLAWQAAVTITSSAAALPSIALSGTGTNRRAVVVWNGTSGTTNVVYSSTRLISGSWTTQQVISDTSTQAGYATIAMDASANASAIWYQYTQTNADYSKVVAQAATRNVLTGTWTSPKTLSTPGIRNPATLTTRVAYDSNGNAVALWNNSYDDITYVIQSALMPVRDDWIETVDIVSNLYGNAADLAVSAFGDAIALYLAYDGSALRIQSVESDLSGFLENVWSLPINISAGAQNGFPKAAITLTGNAINAAAIWIGMNGSNRVINATTGFKNLPLPPSGLSVVQSSTNFGVFTEFYNTLSWTPSTDPNVVGYLIYRDGTLIEQVDANTVEFIDNNRVQSGPLTYGIAAMTKEPIQSVIVTVNYP